ncbi:MAG TPA: hypothetical protein VJ600_04360 [Holophagaceae bacterium]|nr:hypothetical protein [Holophagaceae bacterium]
MPNRPLRAAAFSLFALFPLAAGEDQPSDLHLSGFFSEGWDQPWSHRERDTPDMALLKVTTNFLEREFRLDASRTDVRGNSAYDATDFANGLIAYGVNRRFMIEVISNYQWNRDGRGVVASGSGGGALARFQLVDTATRSVSFQLKVAPPDKGIGQTQTSLSYGLAAWQDLGAILPALGRTGLYGSVQYEDLKGPAKPGARTRAAAADVSLAHTWTESGRRSFRNFTTFLEAYAGRDLDGPNGGQTVASLTPGLRTWFGRKHSLTLGEELPLGQAGAFYRVARLTYIYNF